MLRPLRVALSLIVTTVFAVAQQSQGRQLHFESVGQILFGMEPENQF